MSPLSHYWLGDESKNIGPESLLKLASHRRAIAYIVRVVTGKTLPVKFNTVDKSFTNGKTVTLSARVDEQDYDATVGLACHEGSHVAWTDFDVFENITLMIPKYQFARATKLGVDSISWGKYIRMILNVIEDRRIDIKQYESSPGYQGYYHALYNKYFYTPTISEGLKSKFARDEKLSSYKFRLINILHPDTDLDALKGLRKIWEMIDIHTIDRLQNTAAAGSLSIKIGDVILDYIENYTKDETKKKTKTKDSLPKQKPDEDEQDDNEEKNDSEGDSGTGESDSEEDTNEEGSSDSPEPSENDDDIVSESPDSGDMEPDSDESTEQSGNSNEDAEDSDNEDTDLGDSEPGQESNGEDDEDDNDIKTGSSIDTNDDDGNEEEAEEPKDLSYEEKKQLEQDIQKQEDFLNGKIDKDALNEDDARNVEVMDEASVEVRKVEFNNISYNTIVIKSITKQIMMAGLFPFKNMASSTEMTEMCGDAVKEGIILGKRLGNKLMIRNEPSVDTQIRKTDGKVVRRLLHELASGEMSIFSKTITTEYDKAFLHISIDGSGSMSGNKFERAIKMAVAICKAASMTDNIDVTVSLRGDYGDRPLIATVYDSRKNTFKHIETLFPYLYSPSYTPEGLCFEAVMKDILEESQGRTSYFLNLSDGCPCFDNYRGKEALEHTRKAVDKIRGAGIEVMSYFIGYGDLESRDGKDFKTMYGKDARCIDVASVTEIAKTMNEKFLKH